jgi:hypothetical protein
MIAGFPGLAAFTVRYRGGAKPPIRPVEPGCYSIGGTHPLLTRHRSQQADSLVKGGLSPHEISKALGITDREFSMLNRHARQAATPPVLRSGISTAGNGSRNAIAPRPVAQLRRRKPLLSLQQRDHGRSRPGQPQDRGWAKSLGLSHPQHRYGSHSEIF